MTHGGDKPSGEGMAVDQCDRRHGVCQQVLHEWPEDLGPPEVLGGDVFEVQTVAIEFGIA